MNLSENEEEDLPGGWPSSWMCMNTSVLQVPWRVAPHELLETGRGADHLESPEAAVQPVQRHLTDVVPLDRGRVARLLHELDAGADGVLHRGQALLQVGQVLRPEGHGQGLIHRLEQLQATGRAVVRGQRGHVATGTLYFSADFHQDGDSPDERSAGRVRTARH